MIAYDCTWQAKCYLWYNAFSEALLVVAWDCKRCHRIVRQLEELSLIGDWGGEHEVNVYDE